MSIEKHQEFLASLAARRLPPKEVIDWYCDASLKSDKTGQPLDICLGIRGAGIRFVKNRAIQAA